MYTSINYEYVINVSTRTIFELNFKKNNNEEKDTTKLFGQ